MYTAGMTEAQRIRQLMEENHHLREENRRLREQVDSLAQALAEVEAALAEAPRPPRPSRRNGRRGRNRALRAPSAPPSTTGGAERVAWRRKVIELPPPPPVEVTEHVVLRRWCGVCRQTHTPRLELQGQVLGQGRLGVRLPSLIGYLRLTLRLPYRQIQVYLATLHGVHLSVGELVAVLHRVHARGAGALEDLRAALARQEVLHVDETGWREAGRSGYVWAWVTAGAEAIRYFASVPSLSPFCPVCGQCYFLLCGHLV